MKRIKDGEREWMLIARNLRLRRDYFHQLNSYYCCACFAKYFFFPQKLAGDLARESNVLPSLRKSHKVWVISISRFYICLSHSSSPRRSAFFSPFEASRGERTTENYSASTILDIFVGFSSTPLNAAKHRKGWSISRQRHETPKVFRKVNCLIRVTSLMTKYITESATRRH